MNNFLFEDTIDGGYFFVQADSLTDAYEIIWDEIACEHAGLCFSEVEDYYDCLGEYTDAEAEALGYDTY